MGLKFYTMYVMVPIILSIVYASAKIKRDYKIQRMFQIMKGILYIYLAIALCITKGSDYYVTAFTTSLAILEGMNALIDVFKRKVTLKYSLIKKRHELVSNDDINKIIYDYKYQINDLGSFSEKLIKDKAKLTRAELTLNRKLAGVFFFIPLIIQLTPKITNLAFKVKGYEIIVLILLGFVCCIVAVCIYLSFVKVQESISQSKFKLSVLEEHKEEIIRGYREEQ